MEPQTFHGKTITGKDSKMVYFSDHKRHGTYKALKTPWRSYCIRHDPDPDGHCGFEVTKKIWDTFDVPDISTPEPDTCARSGRRKCTSSSAWLLDTRGDRKISNQKAMITWEEERWSLLEEQ